MVMRILIASGLVCASCNTVWSIDTTKLIDAPPAIDAAIDAPPPPDRDRDGIGDPTDSCIASIVDTAADWDGDGLINSDDDCPFGFDDADTDGDGICVEADPLPLLAGDRFRCLMSFRNVRLNNDLWIPRDDATAWNLLLLGTIGGSGTGTVVAAESLEAPSTTGYAVQVQVSGRPSTAAPSGMTVWLRTTQTAAASDVGCEVRGNASSSTLRVVGGTGSAMSTLTQPITMLTGVHAEMEPGITGRANILCTATWYSAATTVTGEVLFPPGRFGFSMENVTGHMLTLVVTERDDAPDL